MQKSNIHNKRDELHKRVEGIKYKHTELINHREGINQGIDVLEKELLKLDGALGVMEELIKEEEKAQKGQ